ncbi:hypothetical protein BDZ97DRAFT_1756239 [Flammula alnicola]|nr:hypothetical protein BDZ97DRAFT_1925364 [Flammula alnicola]KAF8967191.1 hypothetical protein BDZ97DRAFT_1756239 [Flammula alnicola]
MFSGTWASRAGSSAPVPGDQHSAPAAKVGYGQNYNPGAGIMDKLTGLVQEMTGKITHNPELVHRGHDLFTGEAKRKELLKSKGDGDPAFEQSRNTQKQKAPETTSSGAEFNAQGSSISVVNRSAKEAASSVNSSAASSATSLPDKGKKAHAKSH